MIINGVNGHVVINGDKYEGRNIQIIQTHSGSGDNIIGGKVVMAGGLRHKAGRHSVTVCHGGNGNVVVGNSESRNSHTVIVDGEKVAEITDLNIKVDVHGSVDRILSEHGDVEVHGDVRQVETKHGDVSCNDIVGDVETGHGNVRADFIQGRVKTKFGNVTANDIDGDIETETETGNVISKSHSGL